MPDADAMRTPDLGIVGLSHIVIEASDPDRSAAFYSDVLGFETAPGPAWPQCGTAVTLAAGRGQNLILAAASKLPDLHETGVHQAFGLSHGAREKAALRLKAQGVEIETYGEDPPDETTGGFYFFDPDGNRIQLVALPDTEDDAPPTLHHTAVQVADILWAEQFYTEILGLVPVHRVGWNTADYARAQAWADGKEDMAPGTRRLDKRYSSMVNARVMPRVNPQVYFACGDQRLGVFLANSHFQESPEDACRGTPRIAFRVDPPSLERAQGRLTEASWRFEGPVVHEPGAPVSDSIYIRDPGGNFIELATAGGAHS